MTTPTRLKEAEKLNRGILKLAEVYFYYASAKTAHE